jgi:hypothetical protein
MKFYIIMTDCTDIEQCSLIKEISKKNKFTELNHISSGSTTFSCFEFFNGCNPSNIIKDGVGYLSFGDSDALTKHAPNEARIKYSESNKYEEDWKFLNKEDLNLFHILNKHNIKSIIHNSGWAGRFIKSKQESLYYSNEDLKEYDNIILDYPDFLSQDELNLWGGFRFNKNNSKNYNKFYKYEKKYIKQLQKSKEDLLFFVDDNIYHDLGYNKTSLECLTTFFNSWDFNEPDSVFLVLTDHYGTRSRLFNTELWSVWGMIKDNRNKNDKIGQDINIPLFSSCDVYNTVLDFFNIKNESNYPIISRSMFMPLDKERIYFKEDSRLFVTCFGSDTLNAFKVIKWNNNNPIELLQLIYLKGKTPTDEVDDDIEGIYQIKIMRKYDNTYKKWRETTIYPCNLLNLSDSYLDSQIKLLAISLKEHFKIKDLFDFNSYKYNSNEVITDGINVWLKTNEYKRILDIKQNEIIKKKYQILSKEEINNIPNFENKNLSELTNILKTNFSKYLKQYRIPRE